MIYRLLTLLYIWIRRWVRLVITSNPLMDRTLGDVLRKIERCFKPYKYIIPSSLMRGKIKTIGGILHYRPEDKGVILHILLNGEYEPETTEVIIEILKPGMIFVDLGAHIGYFTLLAAKRVSPTGHVYAFEPVPSTCRLLEQNILINGFQSVVTIVPKAVSEKSGRVRFFLPKNSSVSAQIATDTENGNCIEVETISLDEFFEQIGWPRIDLIKMDIEGAEIQALRGMKELCRRNVGLKLIIEINYPNLIKRKIDLRDIIKVLSDYGFMKFRALKKGYCETWMMPRDLSKLTAIAKRMTFNLLCERE